MFTFRRIVARNSWNSELIEMHSTGIMVWSMTIMVFVCIMDRPDHLVQGLTQTVKAEPGENVTLPCNSNTMTSHIVKWWAHNAYISYGKEISTILGFGLVDYFAICGGGSDYNLCISIPTNIEIWKVFNETYYCRLVAMNGEYSTLQEYQLKISYQQPICRSFYINATTSSIASCSYESNSDMLTIAWMVGTEVSTTINCSSDTCTLNYTYNPKNGNDLTCIVTTSGMIEVQRSCSLMTTLSPDGGGAILTTTGYLTTATGEENTGEFSTSHATMFTLTTLTSGIKETQTFPETTFSSITTFVGDPSQEPQNIPMHLIVIMTIAASIIIFLVIFIILNTRRKLATNESPPLEPALKDDNLYFEIDLQEKPMMESSQPGNIQTGEESIMEENFIYEPADMNDTNKQANDIGHDDVKQSFKIKNNDSSNGDYTNRAYETLDEIGDDVDTKKDEQGPSTYKTTIVSDVADDVEHLEQDNVAYQSIDDIGTEFKRAEFGRSSVSENIKPGYVHYEVLERE